MGGWEESGGKETEMSFEEWFFYPQITQMDTDGGMGFLRHVYESASGLTLHEFSRIVYNRRERRERRRNGFLAPKRRKRLKNFGREWIWGFLRFLCFFGAKGFVVYFFALFAALCSYWGIPFR